ncbi:chromate transporter [Irregularibacter muris]|uniref:Chromate transporter n=1 Tax=Irregularibacter muris TaxID=1796619 RepID=A0AAE3HE98_9FIRM|nr:chromate transporter [Irregularibacter muris]MCR1898885.1 chromate transporter [Irregularibacter muris]
MIFIQLFLTFFKIGLFSFGGGYAMLSMMQQEVVSINQWTSVPEFVDMVAISQVTPGPIAINMSTYVGYKIAGVLGSAIATLGCIAPSVIIMLIITRFFFKFQNNPYVENAFLGLRPTTIGLVAAAAILVAEGAFIDIKSLILFAIAFLLSYKYKIDPILMTIGAGVAGFILY